MRASGGASAAGGVVRRRRFTLSDLASPPGNRLEPLKGVLAGFHSIRINDQWRIVFRWTESGPVEVDIRDDH